MTGDQTKTYTRQLVNFENKDLINIGYQKLTIDGTARSLTVPATARYAEIQLESSITTPAIRYKILGTSELPTSTDGISMSSLTIIDIRGYQNLINFRAIQVGAGTHTLHILYYK